MNCDFELLAGTQSDYRCRVCGLTLRGVKKLPIHARCGATTEPLIVSVREHPVGGPGTELKELLSSLSIEPLSGCKCEWQARQMDAWGVSGCRGNFDLIVGWLRASYDQIGWLTKLKAAAHSITSGVALSIDFRDPPRSLVEIAIRRAETKKA